MMDSELLIFEKKSLIYVLMTVKENPGLTKTEIMRLEPGNERTKFVRIKDLIDADLIQYKMNGMKWNSMNLYLTPKGQEIAALIEKMSGVLKKDKEITNEGTAKLDN